jgi:two-component system NtrC family sensor kinase
MPDGYTEATDRKPSLRRELLFNFALLTGAALSLAVITALIALMLQPRLAALALVGLIVADVTIVFLFARHLVARLVLRPMGDLVDAAEALAAGDLERRAPAAETREFSEVAERFNSMTERLLDVQGQLVRAEKLASVGHLAAGVAHEIGNPLGAIATYLDVLRKRGAHDHELLESVQREADRIDWIVQSLLTYARPSDAPTKSLDVGAVLRGTLDLLTRQGALKDLELAVEIAPGLPPVRAKAHLLEQVAVNLVLNASDAAADGTVTVGAAPWGYRTRPDLQERRSDAVTAPTGEEPEFRRSTTTTSRRPWRPELPEGTPGVLIWVADSGPGVPAQDRERVFEPFHTTKDPGHGTGLGLAVVQRLVHDAGGAVWVDDAREGGAAFKVFLPAAVSQGVNGEE